MKVLLQLKSEYKSLTGKDWKPGAATGNTPKKQEQGASAGTPIKQEFEPEPPQDTSMDGLPDMGPLMDKIDKQGNKVRELKAAKAPKVGKMYTRNLWLQAIVTAICVKLFDSNYIV